MLVYPNLETEVYDRNNARSNRLRSNSYTDFVFNMQLTSVLRNSFCTSLLPKLYIFDSSHSKMNTRTPRAAAAFCFKVKPTYHRLAGHTNILSNRYLLSKPPSRFRYVMDVKNNQRQYHHLSQYPVLVRGV